MTDNDNDHTTVNRRMVIAGSAALAATALTNESQAAADQVAEFTVDEAGALHLGPRVIPVPKSISPDAQKYLAMTAKQPRIGWPLPVDDNKATWKRYIKELDEATWMRGADEKIAATGAKIETRKMGGAVVYVATPLNLSKAAQSRAYLDIHGGGLIRGGGKGAILNAAQHSARYGCITYGVDYRMPPDHPYPVGLDDCLAAYRELIDTYQPQHVIIGGGSAGGNLAAAVALKIRDARLPLPAGIVLLTPEVDLTESGDTFQTNRHIDVVLREGLSRRNLLYANGHDLAHPYLSPLFGDFSKGFPPTFLQSGTRDLFLSNVVRMHRVLRRAGVEVELHVWEAMPHGALGESPETEELHREVARFLAKHWGE